MFDSVAAFGEKTPRRPRFAPLFFLAAIAVKLEKECRRWEKQRKVKGGEKSDDDDEAQPFRFQEASSE